jgi:ATP-dependent RNA helicase DeaD
VDAIINWLLSSPEAQTLVFARTRADVAALGRELIGAGFAAVVLSGELDQAARNRALLAFKQGRESVLVATDVAARGIDVQDVRCVIHAEPPTSADAYTHRSGRTGRAGRKGVSHLLITPAQVVPATRLLRAAAIPHHFEPIPSKAAIERATDERLYDELTRDDTAADMVAEQPRIDALARRLLSSGATERAVARLLRSRYAQKAQARDVRALAPPPRQHDDRDDRGRASPPRSQRDTRGRRAERGSTREASSRPDQTYVPFVFSWGGRQGADARRLLAIACRRGAIRGTDVGAIRVEADQSIVEVASSVAAKFEIEAARPDPRNPRAHIRPMAMQDGRGALKRRK